MFKISKLPWPALVSVLLFWPIAVLAADIRRFEDTVPMRVFSVGKFIDQIEFKPDDPSVVIVAHRDNDVALVDTINHSVIWSRTLQRNRGPLNFSSNGRFIAARDGDDLVFLNSVTGADVRRLPIRNITDSQGGSVAEFIRFSADDSKFMLSTATEVYLIDSATGSVEQKYRGAQVPGSLVFIRAIEWSFDERYLFVVGWNGLVVFNVMTGSYIRTIDLASITGLRLRTVRDIRVTQDGAFTAISEGKFVYIVDNQNQQLVGRFLAASAEIQDLNLTKDQCCFIVAALDGTARVYEIASGNQLTRLDDSRPVGQRSSFMSSNSPARFDVVVTGDADGLLRVWRPQ